MKGPVRAGSKGVRGKSLSLAVVASLLQAAVAPATHAAGQEVMPAPHAPLGASPLPHGCSGSLTSFSNLTPHPIPESNLVTLSTMVVSGAGPYLLDVDVTTFIVHTEPGLLSMTVQSPAGTVVTLSSRNGGSAANVFNGTVWDDSANPGGQVPYAVNPGLTTDHPYAPPAVASPLAPEEALDAFFGENPNGTWTLRISQRIPDPEDGRLNGWALGLRTAPGPPSAVTNTYSSTTPVAIPTGPAVVTSTIEVTGDATPIHRMVLVTNITHTAAADLDVTLMSPSGTVVTLTTDNGEDHDDVFNGTVWRDNANPGSAEPPFNNGLVTDHEYGNLTLASPLVPEESLGAFRGEDPTGTWTLTISDDAPGNGGTLSSWLLAVARGPCFVRGDFDNDSETDILWRHELSGQNVLWYMNGTTLEAGEFTTPGALTDTRWKMVGTNDFNGDQRNDILWRHETSGQNVVWYMNRSTMTNGGFLTPAALEDVNWKMAGTGDFNQDGQPDIAWTHQVSGQVVLWYMNGAALASGTFTTPGAMDAAFRLVGVADFSGPLDGKPDFVFRNPATGDNVLWLMDGSVRTAEVPTLALPDARWELVSTGDFNRDLKNDFVWRHATSGQNVVWFMDGPNFLAGTFTTPETFPDVRWRMVGPR